MLPLTPAGFNPLHCGAVVASRLARSGSRAVRGFNPLHCGAVVASRRRPRARSGKRVSIPFIAGQWSLPRDRRVPIRIRLVSIPFIAGQWSLPPGKRPRPRFSLRSQSPSLRGSGRFCFITSRVSPSTTGLNPLHCGAVVASPPSRRRRDGGRQVSIPFIAGQWSLPLLDPGVHLASNPCLNPLHCGAVVASGTRVYIEGRAAGVSIPFIAGQWSLPLPGQNPPGKEKSLNPLHCGAVVASFRAGKGERNGNNKSQSPSLRGSGRFLSGGQRRKKWK